jgi:hypothetical protein
MSVRSPIKRSLSSASANAKSVIITTKQKDTSQAIYDGCTESIALQKFFTVAPCLRRRKRTSYDILSKVGDTDRIISGNTNGIIHAETGGIPPLHDHCDEGIVNQAFFFEHCQDIDTKQLGKRFGIDSRHNIKNTVSAKQAIGHNGVDMRVPLCVITKSPESPFGQLPE